MSRISVQLSKQDYINYLNNRIESLQQEAEELQKKIEEELAEIEMLPWYAILRKGISQENIGWHEEGVEWANLSIQRQRDNIAKAQSMSASAKFTIEI